MSINVQHVKTEEINKVSFNKEDFMKNVSQAAEQGYFATKQAAGTSTRDLSQGDITAEGFQEAGEHVVWAGSAIINSSKKATVDAIATDILRQESFVNLALFDGDRQNEYAKKHIHELERTRQQINQSFNKYADEHRQFMDRSYYQLETRKNELKIRAILDNDNTVASGKRLSETFAGYDEIKKTLDGNERTKNIVMAGKIENYEKVLSSMSEEQSKAIYKAIRDNHPHNDKLDEIISNSKYGKDIVLIQSYQDASNKIISRSKIDWTMKSSAAFQKNMQICQTQIETLLKNHANIGFDLKKELSILKEGKNINANINNILKKLSGTLSENELAQLKDFLKLYSQLSLGEKISVRDIGHNPFFYKFKSSTQQDVTFDGFWKINKAYRTTRQLRSSAHGMASTGINIADKINRRQATHLLKKEMKLKSRQDFFKNKGRLKKADRMGKRLNSLNKAKKRNEFGSKAIGKIASAKEKYTKHSSIRGNAGFIREKIRNRIKSKLRTTKLGMFFNKVGNLKGINLLSKILQKLAMIPMILKIAVLILLIFAVVFIGMISLSEAVHSNFSSSEEIKEVEEVPLKNMKEIALYLKNYAQSQLCGQRRLCDNIINLTTVDGENILETSETNVYLGNLKDILAITWVALVENGGEDVNIESEEVQKVIQPFVEKMWTDTNKIETEKDENGEIVKCYVTSYLVSDELDYDEGIFEIFEKVIEESPPEAESKGLFQGKMTYQDYMDEISTYGVFSGFEEDYLYDEVFRLMEEDWLEKYGIDLSVSMEIPELLTSKEIAEKMELIFSGDYALSNYSIPLKNSKGDIYGYKFTYEAKYRYYIIKWALAGVDFIPYYNCSSATNWNYTETPLIDKNHFGETFINGETLPPSNTGNNGSIARGLDCAGYCAWAYLSGTYELNSALYNNSKVDVPVLNLRNMPSRTSSLFDGSDLSVTASPMYSFPLELVSDVNNCRLISDGGMKPGDIISFTTGMEHFGIYAGKIDGTDYCLQCADGYNRVVLSPMDAGFTYYMSLNDIFSYGRPNYGDDFSVWQGRNGTTARDLSPDGNVNNFLTSYYSGSGRDSIDILLGGLV